MLYYNMVSKRRTVSKKRTVSKSKRNLSGGKRKLNEYFKRMLSAKKAGAKSFTYNNNTYVGRIHKRLGMIYKSK